MNQIWTGIVESRLDSLKIKRVQVRVHSYHTADKNLVPSPDLHWAMVPKNLGIIPEGSFVHGYFLDGEACQFPVVLSAFDGVPDVAPTIDKGFSDQRDALHLAASPRPPLKRVYATDGSGGSLIESPTASRYPYNDDEPTTPRLARNEHIDQTFIQDRLQSRVTGVAVAGGDTWDEPKTEYAARYPFNQVTETESGHIIELDDTPGAERIHVAHRSGTFEETYPDGTKVTKIVRPNFTICMSDDNVYIMGSCNITVNGDCNLLVKGDVVEEIMGDKDTTVLGDYSETVMGDKSVAIYGDLNQTVGGDFNHTVGGGRTEAVVGEYAMHALTISETADTYILETAPAITEVSALKTETLDAKVVTVTGSITETAATISPTAPIFNITGVLKVNGVTVIVP